MLLHKSEKFQEIIDYEIELGRFQIKVIRAYQSNKASCLKQRVYFPEKTKTMTEKDELFKEFFNSEVASVEVLDNAQLAERIIKLEQIAFEARARLTAADDVGKKRKSKKSVAVASATNSDPLASNAINQIDARNKKLSKEEKLIKSLVDLGMSEADARQKLGMGKTLAKLRNLGDARPVDQIEIKAETPVEAASKPFINPFASKG